MSKPQTRSAIKFDLFADAARKAKIETLGDPLQVIARHIDFDHLTQVIDELLLVAAERLLLRASDGLAGAHTLGLDGRETAGEDGLSDQGN